MYKDRQDSKIERLNELRLSRKYGGDLPEFVFYEFGRWHDHSCCSDCCGCDDEYSKYLTLEQYMDA